jgi:acyl-CoA synthetase (AMP-forming)/AMP-acid ligase II
VLTELGRRAHESPDRAAVATLTPDGVERSSWAQLYQAATQVLAGAADVAGGPGPVIVVVDGSAASVAALVGLTGAGKDVVLIEENNSYLTDQGSPLHRIGASTVVGPARGDADTAGFHHVSYDRCRAAAGPAVVPRGPATGQPGAVLQLTSGSTGEPKLARQPLRNVVQGGRTYQQLFGFDRDDVIVSAVGLAHSFGLVGGLAAAVTSGATLWTMQRFGVRALRGLLLDGATTLLASPLVIRLLVPTVRPGDRFIGLRTVLSSGGPLPADLARRAQAALRVPVRQVYGSTETGLIACPPSEFDEWPETSVGKAAPGVTLTLEPGDEGSHLRVHTLTLFEKYVDGPDRPEPTGSLDPGPDHPAPSAGPDRDSYATGDLVTVDADGWLYVVGRKDTFVNVGGRKVNPRRIERIMADCAGVHEVFVFGVEDVDGEQRLHAAVVLDSATGPAEVVEFCRARGLMPFEVPHRVHVLSDLPRTAMGKVDLTRVVAATRTDRRQVHRTETRRP